MEQPWYAWVLPLVHVDVRNCCPRCEVEVRAWARRAGVDPDLIAWEFRGLHATPIRIVGDCSGWQTIGRLVADALTGAFHLPRDFLCEFTKLPPAGP
jgi:hypothetical protein